MIEPNRRLSTKKLKEAIVLSNDEYIRAYSSNGYASSALKKQLEQPCVFIGNSITDYEEQKVIKNQFDNSIGGYHFAFLKFENQEIEFYRMLRLMKIGILPVYFHDYDAIKIELECIARKAKET